jgi:BlaI family penicillinase repressor
MSSSSSRPDSAPAISNAEWEVMKVLWDGGPLAARDVYDALPPGRDWAIKTVKTLLSRLAAKGAVAYEQVGNAYLYRAAVNREQVTRREVRGFVDRVLGGSLLPMLAHFIEADDLSDDEVTRIKAMLNARKRRKS